MITNWDIKILEETEDRETGVKQVVYFGADGHGRPVTLNDVTLLCIRELSAAALVLISSARLLRFWLCTLYSHVLGGPSLLYRKYTS